MLFQTRFHEPIRRGEITCTIRIWQSPRVRVGGRYQLGSGCVQVLRIQELDFDGLSPALARRSGFASIVELLKVAKHGAGERIFLIEFRYIDAPAKQRAADSAATDAVLLADLNRKLDAMDRRAKQPWTRATLAAIKTHPGLRAADLAMTLDRPRDEFKRDVRKLKALGLTVSLETGYQLSRRGAALIKPRRSAARKK